MDIFLEKNLIRYYIVNLLIKVGNIINLKNKKSKKYMY